MSAQFEIFWKIVTETLEFPKESQEATRKLFLNALTKANYGAPIVQVQAQAAGAKRLSGWNLFMKQRMADLKEEVKSGSERLKRIGGEWKGLSKEDQEKWNAQARGQAPVQEGGKAAKGAGAKHLSGWNLFMKQMMVELKEEVKSGSERLKRIGTEWKGLSKEKQEEWNARAKGEVADE